MVSPGGFERTGVRAEVQGVQAYVRDAQRVNAATTGMVRTSQGAARQTGGLDRNVQSFGRSALAASIGVGALSVSAQLLSHAFGGTVGAAIAFEDSFAGIRKTVDATEEEFGRLASANRALAREIPAGVDEINRVGELAGQLGVEGVDNIQKFERVVIDLANTTDLSAEAAATSFAQIANVTQLPIQEIDRLGATIVELGNKSAATESGIVDFTQRISGAGKIAGLTVAEIAGIGTAFASVGVEAEAGGTAAQKVLIQITKAVAQGGDDLEAFAKTAGLTADEFRKLAREDPAEAFIRFVEGLARAGDEAFQILDDLSLADQRLLRSFTGVAGAGDLLRRSIETGTRAFRENTALTTEAEKRYRTTASQLKILGNNFRDIGISLTQGALPPLVRGSSAATDLLRALKPLGDLLPSIATGLVAVGAAFAAFVAIRAAASITQAAVAFAQLGAEARSAGQAVAVLQAAGISPLGVGLVALTATVAGLDLAFRAFTGGGLLDYLTGAHAARKRSEELAAELKRLNEIAAAPLGGGIGDAVAVEAARLERATEALAALDQRRVGREGATTREFVRQTREVEAARAAIRALLEAAGPEDRREIIFRLRVEGADLDSEIARIIREEEAAATLLHPRFVDLSADLKELDAAERAAAAGGAAVVESLEEGEDAAQTFGEALDRAMGLFEDRIDPVTASLQNQVNVLEQQRRALQASGADTADLDAKIAALNNQIDRQAGSVAITNGILTQMAAALQESGVSAAAAERELGDFARALDDLPEEQRIAIALALPDLEMNRLLRFLDLVEQGVSIPVALRIATTPGTTPSGSVLPGLGGGQVPGQAAQLQAEQEQALRDIAFANGLVTKSTREAAAASGAFADAVGGGGGVTEQVDRLTQILDAAGDGVVTLSEAVNLGLSDAQVVTLELEVARQREEEAAFRSRIEFEKMARVLGSAGLTSEAFQFQLALRAIAEELARTNRTADQFRFDVLNDQLEDFKSRLERLFSTPTRESLELELRLRKLELRRAQRRAAGASDEDLEDLDKQIQQVRDLIAIREAEADIAKLQIQLDDATIQSDQDVIAQAKLLQIAIRDTSQEVKSLEGAVFFQALAAINAGNASNELADKLRALAAVVPPATASGGVFDRPQIRLIAEAGSEAVVPLTRPLSPELQRALGPVTSGAGTTIVLPFSPSLTVSGQIDRATLRRVLRDEVDQFVDEAFSRGRRLGATVSSGIG